MQNAVHAIEARWPDGGGILTIETRDDGGTVALSIADNGAGMAPDVVARVFEPLFSTKAFGVGLGMPLVRRVVDQHQGTIAIDSAEGQGTTVTLRLPRQAGRAG